jgi:hypothetical protein
MLSERAYGDDRAMGGSTVSNHSSQAHLFSPRHETDNRVPRVFPAEAIWNNSISKEKV